MLNTLGPTLFSEYFAFMSTYQPQANAWLSSTAIAAASTQSTWRPTWAYADQGLDATTYKGNCLNGYGCSIALTWTANNGTGGLQYVDAGLPLGVLCKAFLAPLTSNTTGNNTFYPLPSGNNTQPSNYTTGNNTFYPPTFNGNNAAPYATATIHPPGSTFVDLYINVTLTIGNNYACQSIQNFPEPFNYAFEDSTVASWNASMDQNPSIWQGIASPYILTGDIFVLTSSVSCVGSNGSSPSNSGNSGGPPSNSRNSGCPHSNTPNRGGSSTGGPPSNSDNSGGSSGAGTVVVYALAGLPTSFSLSMAIASEIVFQANAQAGYTSGQFASNYNVIGASVAFTRDPAIVNVLTQCDITDCSLCLNSYTCGNSLLNCNWDASLMMCSASTCDSKCSMCYNSTSCSGR